MVSMFLEQQICILELFLKDHVTLKAGVMAAKLSACHYKNKMYELLVGNKVNKNRPCPIWLYTKLLKALLKKPFLSQKNIKDPIEFLVEYGML